MNPRPRKPRVIIGLTGNIATGKSEVAGMLARLGAYVIDADKVAHRVMQPGGPAHSAVVDAIGPEILAPDGTIDRRKLGGIVFRDPAALRRLEAAVHPATGAEIDRIMAQVSEPVIVVEAIKLIEAGMHRDYDTLWVVTAPRELQISRLQRTRGLTEQEAALRVDAQPPQEEKAALADLVIRNDGDLTSLQDKVKAAWTMIQAGCSAPSSELPSGQVTVRPVCRDDIQDAAGVADVLNTIIAEEQHHTALTGHWTPEAELAFLQSLRPRSQVFVADLAGRIVGFQVIEPFVTYTKTMDHVAHWGTYVHPGFRRRGIGRQLAGATLEFARTNGYEKVVIYVLADNAEGLAYYRSLGFERKGVLARQTKIDGIYHDEVFMELHFGAQAHE